MITQEKADNILALLKTTHTGIQDDADREVFFALVDQRIEFFIAGFLENRHQASVANHHPVDEFGDRIKKKIMGGSYKKKVKNFCGIEA